MGSFHEHTVLAIDPGKTCGYVVAIAAPQGSPLFPPPRAMAGECNTEQVIRLANHLLAGCNGDTLVVVVESFRLIPSKARDISGQRVYAAEALGAVREWCDRRKVTLVEQPPTVTKTVGKALLEMFRLWEKTKGHPHARDAARHFVAYTLALQRGGTKKCLTN